MATDETVQHLAAFFQRNKSGLELGGEPGVLHRVAQAGLAIAGCLERDGLVLSAGNGGSMADAMHLAEELSGKYRNHRRALRALALSDPTFLSCVANDFGYEQTFARGCEAILRNGDCAVLYSTSGKSPNVLTAAKAAKERGAVVVGLTGRVESPLGALCDIILSPSVDVETEIAQLIHTMWTHMLIETVETALGL